MVGLRSACLALLLLAYPAAHAWSAEPGLNPAFAARVARAQQAEEQARHALERALSIQARAESAQNVRALQVARLAIRRAQDALAQARAVRAERERHLKAARRAAESLPANAASNPLNGAVFGLPTNVTGDVRIKTKHGWKPLNASTRFGPGDVVETGEDSHVEFVTPDGFIVHMGPKSSLQASVPPRRSRWERFKGRVRFTVMCVKKKGLARELTAGRHRPTCMRPAVLRLSRATAAVRGTEFEVESIDERAIRIRVTEGTVELTLDGHEAPIDVPAGHEAILRDDHVEGPQPFEQAQERGSV